MRRLAFLAVALGLLDAAAAREAPALGARGRARVDAEEDDFSLGPSEDRVAFLPGYGVPPFPQYSGFLDASAAEPGTHLHYWFARCEQEDWATRPTVLWLNGGPGSSSVLGWLQEMGPLLVNRTGGLTRNPWAWTRQANVFVLESPAGVGYSYCEAQKKGGACSNTDNSTAATSLAALERFFFEKFPKLAENDFYVAGESYAGVYVPTLARAILERNERELLETASVSSSRDDKNENPVKLIPLAGVAVGDPCTDNAFQRDSMDALWYSNKHGLVDSEDFKMLWNECGHRYPNARAKHLSRGRWHRDSSVPGAWRGWDDDRDEKDVVSTDRSKKKKKKNKPRRDVSLRRASPQNAVSG
jgi:cathepsin A (carboxypeptidase C)